MPPEITRPAHRPPRSIPLPLGAKPRLRFLRAPETILASTQAALIPELRPLILLGRWDRVINHWPKLPPRLAPWKPATIRAFTPMTTLRGLTSSKARQPRTRRTPA